MFNTMTSGYKTISFIKYPYPLVYEKTIPEELWCQPPGLRRILGEKMVLRWS
jgi:hypothetical protein